MIKVLIVDDQKLIRESLSMMLSLYDSVDVIDGVENGKKAIEYLGKNEVDLILMDIRMPGMDGVEATKVIKEKYPDVKIIILTTFNEDEYIFEGLKNGADGYLLKDISSEDLVKSIEAVYGGRNMLLQTDIARRMIDSIHKEDDAFKSEIKGKFEDLTRREYEIAVLVGKGKSNKEISEELFIAEGTVKNHLTKILDKLDIRNRTQLAVLIKR